MDFNTLLTRFGFDSSNFVNKESEPIEIEGGFAYEVEEKFRAKIMLILTYKKRWCLFSKSTTLNFIVFELL